MSGIKFVDNSQAVRDAMKQAKKKALTAVGLRGVEETINYMQHGYGRNIYLSGDAQRSISSQVKEDDDLVQVGGDPARVGGNLEYLIWVHNGTRRMTARPFLRDAISENTDIWQEVAAEHLGDGMK